MQIAAAALMRRARRALSNLVRAASREIGAERGLIEGRQWFGVERVKAARMMIVPVSHMLHQLKPRAVSLCFFSCAVLLCCAGLHAQENCNVEVKLLLTPTETQAAVVALSGTKATRGRVYFFDTDALDLLSQGAIVRLRQGARSDLTVKLRSPNGKEFFAPSQRRDDFKCEVDLTRDGANPSYSITSRFTAEQLPQTGHDVSRLLSPAQMMLLNDAQVSVDWTRVKRITEIKSTDWRTESEPQVGKLTLELWEWPGGKVLELSTRVSSDAGSSTYTELQHLVRTKLLRMSSDQRVKTSIALEAITNAAAH
jgi:hypothetical protein